MYAEERRRLIADETVASGRVTVVDLARRLHVATETIRRDLNVLAQEGRVHRVHGGAVSPTSLSGISAPGEISLKQRSLAQTSAKQQIAHEALRYAPHLRGSIFLDSGSTVIALAELLAEHKHEHQWNMVTNSLPIALRLATPGASDVQLLGGQVRAISESVVGNSALKALADMRADVAFVGTNAITIDHGLSTADPLEAATKSAMIENARRVVVLCDSSKIGSDFLVRFATIKDIDVLITDSDADPVFLQELKDCGVDVVVAPAS